ncbi:MULTISPECIES: MarR family winged helix-turn-helix transcriptional regulator [unclassified Blastococcus]
MSSDIDLVSALSLVGAAADRHVLADLRAAGFPEVRPAHGYVVQRLVAGPQTATQMAADLGVSQQAVAKLTGEMTRLGLVERVAEPGDARRRPLALTDRGRAVLAAARDSRARLAAEITAAAGGEVAVGTALGVLRAAMGVLGIADAVRQRRVPLPPEAGPPV